GDHVEPLPAQVHGGQPVEEVAGEIGVVAGGAQRGRPALRRHVHGGPLVPGPTAGDAGPGVVRPAEQRYQPLTDLLWGHVPDPMPVQPPAPPARVVISERTVGECLSASPPPRPPTCRRPGRTGHRPSRSCTPRTSRIWRCSCTRTSGTGRRPWTWCRRRSAGR